MQWERVKKAGMAPSPRSSFGLATHRQRAVLFGGAPPAGLDASPCPPCFAMHRIACYLLPETRRQ